MVDSGAELDMICEYKFSWEEGGSVRMILGSRYSETYLKIGGYSAPAHRPLSIVIRHRKSILVLYKDLFIDYL